MEEGQRKIVEGLKLLVNGLLDQASDFAEAVEGIESFKNAPSYLVDRARELLDQTREPYYKSFFPERDYKELDLRYKLVSGKVSRLTR